MALSTPPLKQDKLMMGLGEDVMWDGRSRAGLFYSFSSSNFLSGFGKRMTVSFVIQPHVNLSGLCVVLAFVLGSVSGHTRLSWWAKSFPCYRRGSDVYVKTITYF